MTSFSGNYAVAIDAKGRAAIPSRMREGFMLSGVVQVIVTKAFDEKCIRLYTRDAWQQKVQELDSKPTNNPAFRQFRRQFVGNAYAFEADAAGRILLPQPLLEYASISKKSMFVGQGSKVEIWNEQRWLVDGEMPIDPYQLVELEGMSF